MWTALTFGILTVLAIVAYAINDAIRINKSGGEFFIHPSHNLWAQEVLGICNEKAKAKLKQAMFRDLVAMKDRSGLAIMETEE